MFCCIIGMSYSACYVVLKRGLHRRQNFPEAREGLGRLKTKTHNSKICVVTLFPITALFLMKLVLEIDLNWSLFFLTLSLPLPPSWRLLETCRASKVTISSSIPLTKPWAVWACFSVQWLMSNLCVLPFFRLFTKGAKGGNDTGNTRRRMKT